jgi:DNA primase
VARIADTSVEAVKAAADVVEVISGRTQLKRSGARFTGLCPFHDERTPSFSVSPEKGTYYCFGCQRGGDTISFVEETEGVDFVGAIEWLAQRLQRSARVRGGFARAGREAPTAGPPLRRARRGGCLL